MAEEGVSPAVEFARRIGEAMFNKDARRGCERHLDRRQVEHLVAYAFLSGEMSVPPPMKSETREERVQRLAAHTEKMLRRQGVL